MSVVCRMMDRAELNQRKVDSSDTVFVCTSSLSSSSAFLFAWLCQSWNDVAMLLLMTIVGAVVDVFFNAISTGSNEDLLIVSEPIYKG